jgi:hypothetical protein
VNCSAFHRVDDIERDALQALNVNSLAAQRLALLCRAENCVLLCGTGVQGCHGWVENNPDAACAEGFHVRPWNEPELIPVLWRGSQWVFLTEDGKVQNV